MLPTLWQEKTILYLSLQITLIQKVPVILFLTIDYLLITNKGPAAWDIFICTNSHGTKMFHKHNLYSLINKYVKCKFLKHPNNIFLIKSFSDSSYHLLPLIMTGCNFQYCNKNTGPKTHINYN